MSQTHLLIAKTSINFTKNRNFPHKKMIQVRTPMHDPVPLLATLKSSKPKIKTDLKVNVKQSSKIASTQTLHKRYNSEGKFIKI